MAHDLRNRISRVCCSKGGKGVSISVSGHLRTELAAYMLLLCCFGQERLEFFHFPLSNPQLFL